MKDSMSDMYLSHRTKAEVLSSSSSSYLLIYVDDCCCFLYSQSIIRYRYIYFLVLDYGEVILPHHSTSAVSSLDCLSMIVESIDPNKLVSSSSTTNGTSSNAILNRCC